MFGLNFSTVALLSSVAAVAITFAGASRAVAEDMGAPAGGPALNFTVKDIAGADVNLASKYGGKVVLILNVASKCGHTKQYAGLQKLHEQYKDKGLAVLGFPANDFGGQEPGTEAEIVEFCSSKYNVSFDLFSKVRVKGSDAAPLFQYLTNVANDTVKPGPVGWNFEKFLIGKDGKLVARFKSGIQPEAPELVKAIEAELAK